MHSTHHRSATTTGTSSPFIQLMVSIRRGNKCHRVLQHGMLNLRQKGLCQTLTQTTEDRSSAPLKRSRDSQHSFLLFWYKHLPAGVADSLPRFTRQMENLPAFDAQCLLISDPEDAYFLSIHYSMGHKCLYPARLV